MKHYEVTVQAVAMVYVADAKSEEDAIGLARHALDCGDFDDLTMTAVELTTEHEQQASLRHADAKSLP